MIINLIAGILGIVLCVSGSYVAAENGSAQSSALALALLGACVFLLAVLGFQGGRKEKNWMLLIYFYSVVLISGALFLFSVAAIAFQDSFESYVSHHWDTDSLAYMREEFCPEGTAEAECKVPGEYTTSEDVLAWCQEEYERDDCEQIRDDAVSDGEAWLEEKFMVAGLVGLGTIVFLGFAMWYSVRILTVPIVMKSMLNVINLVFLFVGGSVAAVGFYAYSHEELDAGNEWIAYMYSIVGLLICVLAYIGAMGARTKNRALLAVYIGGVGIVAVLMLVCGIGAWVFTGELEDAYADKDAGEIQDLACSANLYGCSNCDGATASELCEDDDAGSCTVVERCPEWSKEEVISVIETNLKFLGLLAFIVELFLITALIGAVVLRKSLHGYQSDTI